MPEQQVEINKPQQPSKPMEDDDEFEEFDVEGGCRQAIFVSSLKSLVAVI